MVLQVKASHVSRRDLISERDDAQAALKEQQHLRETELEELNIIKASRDSLQISLDETEKKLKEAVGVIKAINKQAVDLEGRLKANKDAFAAYKASVGRLLRWRSSRFNYVCFKNAVMQLKICHPGLDVSRICPNKHVDGKIIRDTVDADPSPNIPPMPSNFRLEGYLSKGDPEFPCYQDDGVPISSESSGSGENAEGVEGSGEAAEDAEGIEDVAAEEIDPPIV